MKYPEKYKRAIMNYGLNLASFYNVVERKSGDLELALNTVVLTKYSYRFYYKGVHCYKAADVAELLGVTMGTLYSESKNHSNVFDTADAILLRKREKEGSDMRFSKRVSDWQKKALCWNRSESALCQAWV